MKTCSIAAALLATGLLAAPAVAAPAAPPPHAAAVRWVDHVVLTPDGGYLMGNPNARVKVIEYGSRTCPHCARFAREGVPALKAKYVAAGTVSYEFRDFPIHAPDLAAILLGQCGGVKTFFPTLEAMFADQDRVLEVWSGLGPQIAEAFTDKTPTEQSVIWADKLGYIKFFVQHGLPATQAHACLTDAAAVTALGHHLDGAAKRFDVDQTPFFVINGVPARGASDWAALEAAIRAAGA